MAFLGFAFAAILIGLGVASGRWIATRAFGIRGAFREMVNTGEERGRPKLAFARLGAAMIAVYLACVLMFIPAFASGKPGVDEASMRVTVSPSGPAARAGIENGDRIVSVNGETPRDWDHLKKLVGAHPDEVIHVDVERAGEKKSFEVTTVGPKMMVGPFFEVKKLSAGEVLAASFAGPFEVVRGIVRGTVRMFSGSEKPELSGPVGITKEVNAAAQDNTGTFLRLIAGLASYQALFVDFALLIVAVAMSILPKRNSMLPTSGDSS